LNNNKHTNIQAIVDASKFNTRSDIEERRSEVK